jgi:hypothetical protein
MKLQEELNGYPAHLKNPINPDPIDNERRIHKNQPETEAPSSDMGLRSARHVRPRRLRSPPQEGPLPTRQSPAPTATAPRLTETATTPTDSDDARRAIIRPHEHGHCKTIDTGRRLQPNQD